MKLLYVKLEEADPDDLMMLLNKEKIRAHLVEHELFDSRTIRKWIKEKNEMDRTSGCRVRGIMSGTSLAGWCGIQLDNGKYEMAIVLDAKHWGIGIKVFNDLMCWAKELGHDEVFVHLRHTRPEYKFLKKLANKVYKSEQLGEEFTTYEMSVAQGRTQHNSGDEMPPE